MNNTPQSLPQDESLKDETPNGLPTPDEKLKRIEREGELNKIPADVPNNIGPDTTGVGQPVLQPINQGQSLPPSVVPVENEFLRTDKLYDPNEAETAIAQRDRALRGGQKAE